MKRSLISFCLVVVLGAVLFSSCNFRDVVHLVGGAAENELVLNDGTRLKASEKTVRKVYPIQESDFNALRSDYTFDIIVTTLYGNEPQRMEVELPENFTEYFGYRISDHALIPAWNDGVRNANVSVTVRLYVHSLSELYNNGTGDLTLTNGTRAESLQIHSGGTGDTKLTDVTYPHKVRVVNGGTGDVDFSGLETQTFDATNSGTGDLGVDGKVKGSAVVLNSGTGDVTLVGTFATLKVNNSGTGDVSVSRATVEKKEYHNSGTGDIQ